MKRSIFLFFLAFVLQQSYGQFQPGQVFFECSGNYMKSGSSEGSGYNGHANAGKYLEVGGKFNFMISDKFELSLGMNYDWANESSLSEIYLFGNTQIDAINSKSNVFIPNINFGYYIPVISKLYFKTNLNFGYGIYKFKYTGVVAGNQEYTGDGLDESNAGYTVSYESKDNGNFLSTTLSPELIYFLKPRFGISITMGGMGYTMYNGKFDNSEWKINFNPSYWSLGFKVKIF